MVGTPVHRLLFPPLPIRIDHHPYILHDPACMSKGSMGEGGTRYVRLDMKEYGLKVEV